MARGFHTLKIKSKQLETADACSLALEIPDSLVQDFQFVPGQYLTFKTLVQGEELRRSYSICSSPAEGECRVAVKKVPGGKFSGFVHESLQVGDSLEVMPPLGKFGASIAQKTKGQYLAFAAGSGITPILSIVKHCLATQPESHFTLVYGNRNRHSIMFKEALEALKNKYMQRFRLVYLLSREKTESPLHFGRIDGEKTNLLCQHLIDVKALDDCLLCGPQEMVMEVKEALVKEGLDPAKIHVELFTTAQANNPNRKTASEKRSTASAQVTVKIDGHSLAFDLPFDGASILDGALQQGADLPFACKGGVCCTCKAKLVEGEVEMAVNYGLEQEEINHGFVLTCQSRPLTEKVVIDFDEK